jgi:3'-phosphoadenosine 5'-phosphosulfate sulfotransferase (PAPS reductase)/FAD synthetase
MQSLPLEAKIVKTKMRIREWYDHWDGNVYISFSGGKDSTVLLHIIRQVYPDLPAVFINTGLEYPEIREFVKTIDNIVIVKPEMTFKEVLDKYGYPIISKEQAGWIKDYQTGGTQKRRDRIFKVSKKWQYLKDAPFKISDECCNYIKKKPMKLYEKETGNKPFIGNIAEESSKRLQDYLKFGCNAFDAKRPISRPLGFWTEQDILQYLKEYKLPYAEIYGEIKENNNSELYLTGEPRTGCMFCMFGCHLEKEPNKFQRMKITHPKLYNYCMNQLGLKEVLEYINVSYE